MKLSSLVMGVAVAAAFNCASVASAQQPNREITISLSSSSLGVAAPRVAKELGLFAKHGLSANIVPMDSGATSLAALISKSADASMVGPNTVIAASARGQKLVAIANGYGGFAITMVLSKAVVDQLGVSPTAPVVDRLKAVNGLLIAGPDPTAAGTVGFRTAAATVGSTMRFTYMAQEAMASALESGAVQGYVASAPLWAGPVLNGKGVVWLSGPKGELPEGTVTGTSVQLYMLRESAERDPALAKSLAAVFADLREAINTRPAEVKAAAAKLFPNVSPQTLDVVFPFESAAWNAKPLTAADMAREIEVLKASGASIAGIENVNPASLLFP